MPEASGVVIVGAGPAGAALAWLLAARGFETTLLERQRDFEREFRGEVMMPGGLRALDEMGLGDEVPTLPHQRPSRLLLSIEGRLALDLPLVPEFFDGRPPITLSQPHLLERIVERAGEHGSFRFERGATVRGLIEAEGRVTGIRYRDDDGEHELAAALVVGCDGRGSVVRRRGGFEAEASDLPMDVVWCKLPWPSSWADDAPTRAFVGGGHLLIALRAPDGLLQVAWVILKGTWGELRARPFPDWIRLMAEHADPELAAHFRRHSEEASRPFLLDAQADRVRGWSRPGALLLGDAAHTMSPVGAQGINVALRDAVVAANHLVPALRARDPAALDAAGAAIEAERGPEIDAIQRAAAAPPRLVLARGATARVLRAAIPWLIRLPLARLVGVRQARVFTEGTAEVRLCV